MLQPTVFPGDQELADAADDLAVELPEPLRPLAGVAYNYRWAWTATGADVFERIDPERWHRCGCNPVRLLDETHRKRLNAVAEDKDLLRRIDDLVTEIDEDLARPWPTWGSGARISAQRPVAFFSAEFAVHGSLPVYSGGLGVLSGDLLKEASDLGVPVIGVGLLYRSGYFHQRLALDGWQHEYWTDTDPDRLPAVLVKGHDGQPLRVRVPVANEDVTAQVWRIAVGRVPLYLLDTDLAGNSQRARWITSRLYEGNRAVRLAQYAMLGVGGVKALRALGLRPAVHHLNEGHPALAVFELFDELAQAGVPREEVWTELRQRVVLTTHTPVAAGNETYDREEILSVLGRLADRHGDREEFLRVGRMSTSDPTERSGMTVLAMRAARAVNGVSRRHGEVARSMWQPLFPGRSEHEVPITHITNGVHAPSWIRGPMRELLNRHLGPGWLSRADQPATWHPLDDIPDDELWQARCDARQRLVDLIRARATTERLRRGEGVEYAEAVERVFDDRVLTIGFARRLAEYKRLHLVALDPARAIRLLASPAQFVFAGKAHPQDEPAKRIVQRMFELRGVPDLVGRVTFLEDYDLSLAGALVAGCDVWLNLPRPPLEASGTSGMKAAMNGALNVSVLDGWWAEAYDGTNGWAIDGSVDPDAGAQDARHAAVLFDVLEGEVVPLFQARDATGQPHGWLTMVRSSLKTIGSQFSTSRMLREYVERIYTPV